MALLPPGLRLLFFRRPRYRELPPSHRRSCGILLAPCQLPLQIGDLLFGIGYLLIPFATSSWSF
jgi:hypothetical protein